MSSSVPPSSSIRRCCIGVRIVSSTAGGDTSGVCGDCLKGVAPVDGTGDCPTKTVHHDPQGAHVTCNHIKQHELLTKFLVPLA